MQQRCDRDRTAAVSSAIGKLGQRHDVRPRHHEHVALEHRTDVEERDDVGLVEDDVRRRGTGDDRAEEAIVAGHGGLRRGDLLAVAPR